MRVPSKKLVICVGTTLGATLTVLLVVYYGPMEVLEPLLHSHLGLLAFVLGMQFLYQGLIALSQAILLRSPGQGSLSAIVQSRYFLAVQPLTLLTPGRLADLGAIPLMRKYYKTGTVLSSILLDKIVSALLLLLLIPPTVRYLFAKSWSTQWTYLLLALLALTAAAPFIAANRTVRNTLNRRVFHRWPALLEGSGAHLELLLKSSPRLLLLNFFLTAMKILVSAAVVFSLALNVGLSIDLLAAISITVVTQAANMIPISVMGLGIREVSLVFIFSVLGLPEPAALSISFLARILFFAAIIIIYFSITLPVVAGSANDARKTGC